MKYSILFLSVLFFYQIINAQSPRPGEPLAHTYSIVALDPETGEMGAAVQSHWFSVGTLVIWGEPGVGVVATQSFVNPDYGPDGLELMALGFSPDKTINMLTEKDPGKMYRQVGMLNANGEAASFTGDKCIEAAGHFIGENFAVQANLMDNDQVWPAMAKAFEESEGMMLAERMLNALEAAEAEGGDIRGKQSAAMIIVSGDKFEKASQGRNLNLRVDDHLEPLAEMKRLLKVHRAYEHMNKGDLAVEKGNMELAEKEYFQAETLFPDNLEMKYWHAIALVNSNHLNEALPIFHTIFNQNPKWRELTPRLIKNGLLTINDSELKRILAQ